MDSYIHYSPNGVRLREFGQLSLAPISVVQGTGLSTDGFAAGSAKTPVQMDAVQVPPRGQPL